jgi:hypothetical protein
MKKTTFDEFKEWASTAREEERKPKAKDHKIRDPQIVTARKPHDWRVEFWNSSTRWS